MSTDFKQLLSMCEEQGVEISLNDGDLDIFFDDYPTDELIDQLRANKPGLIDYLGQYNSRVQSSMKLLPIDVLSRQQPGYQLSFSQQRVWFVEQLEQGTAQFTMPGMFELTGEVNPVLVEQAFQTIVERHLVLATTYDKDALGNPLQRLNQQPLFKLGQLDLSSESPGALQQKVDEAITANSHQCFDLGADLMIKVTLVKKADNQWLLLLALHHIAADGLSIGLLLKEFKSLYQNAEAQLPEVPVQYIDYAAWQQSGFEQGLLAEQAQYWQDKLAQLPLVHALPTDFARSQGADFAGAVVHQTVPAQLLGKLDQLCSDQNVSRFTVLYAVYGCLIARYSNSRDVVIGTPAANRDRLEFENLLGLFVNSLVLRLDVNPDANFASLLDTANTTLLEAQQNKDIPFEVIVENLNPQRNAAISPLFQLFFTMNRVEQDSVDGLDINPLPLKERLAKYDLTLSATESGGQIELGFEYSKALFKASFIEQFAAHFVTLLGAVLDNHQVAISRVELLSNEQKAALHTFARPANPVESSGATLHGLVEAQGKLQPVADALVCKDYVWSHQTLQQWSNVFADKLTEQGVQSGDTVAIALGRNSVAVAWALAILKVGAAYVPLDQSMPLARLKFITEDAGVKVVVSDHHFDPVINQLQQTFISADMSGFAKDQQATTDWPAVDPDQLAYIIYTSGSTGIPKGVKVSHQNAVSFISAMQDKLVLPTQGKGVWLGVTPFAFDISVLEIFGALSAGFKLLLSPDQRLNDESEIDNNELTLAELLDAHQVTHIQCTPSMATMLLADSDIRDKLSGLQKILLGGEVLSETLVVQLRSFFNVEIHNMYGPTEATVWATSSQVIAGEDITIGKPLAHARAYVVDAQNQLVPHGAKGELMLAGPCVAMGYQSAQHGKRQVFVDDPFSPGEGAYLTGDLVRMNADGSLQYHGRNDQQIKLRGFRIELADIDSHLEQLDDVNQAMAVLSGDSYQDKKIIAYFTLSGGCDQNQQDWPSHLQQLMAAKLPDYMVPSQFVQIDSIPMTTSGKKDRRVIAGLSDQNQNTVLVAAQTDTEKALLLLWRDVLDVERLGVTSNFFELGGHSLLLAKLQTVISEQFGYSIPIRTLFERNSIRAQAQIIDVYQLEAAQMVDEGEFDEEFTV